MSSRNLEWADEIRRRTGGRGVDVILNSIGGEAIDRGLEVLASNGRFLELGVRDLHSGRVLDLEPFRRSLAFATINVATIDLQRDRAVIDEIRQWVAEEKIQPLPVRVFPPNDIIGAFQYMTKGVHIGRIVVCMKGAEILTLAD